MKDLHQRSFDLFSVNEAALQALILEAVGLNKSQANEPSCYESPHLS
jgi:hypothetical protein